MPEPEISINTLSLEHLALFTGLALSETSLAALHARGFVGLRFQHGFVFQHLLRETPTISELARWLEISQQAASKRVRELVRLGYLVLAPDPNDARVSRVRLSERGVEAVEAARALRAERQQALADLIGAERLRIAEEVLTEVLATTGDPDAIAQRRIQLPR